MAALFAGFLLRLLFVWKHPRFVGDTLIYGDLAQNMLQRHAYALTEDGAIRSTLIRLPGYPLFLAACFVMFGVGEYVPVLWVQVFVDLLGCWMLARVAGRLFGEKVRLVCLWLAALCPFTANYTAAALTETLSIFCVVLAFWGLVEWMRDGRLRWAAVVGVALSGAVLLRPDGVLLSGAVLPAMVWWGWRGYRQQVPRSGNDKKERPGQQQRQQQQQLPLKLQERELEERQSRRQDIDSRGDKGRGLRGWGGVVVAAGVVLVCVGVWAARNWRVFHVVQPLAPKYANDPGEPVPWGFSRWYRTWGTGLGDTARVYWEYDGSTLSLDDLPSWAFDDAAQRAETAAMYARYNAESSSTPAIEEGFARLAAERVRARPVRFYVLMPLLRLGDMWLRPRTELMGRHMPLDWWDVRARPGAALFSWVYGALNVALLGFALAGWVRWWRAGWRGWGTVAATMVGFVLLRSALLMTIDNSEPRYVLECYPVVVLLAAVGVCRWTGLAKAERA